MEGFEMELFELDSIKNDFKEESATLKKLGWKDAIDWLITKVELYENDK